MQIDIPYMDGMGVFGVLIFGQNIPFYRGRFIIRYTYFSLDPGGCVFFFGSNLYDLFGIEITWWAPRRLV